MAIEVHRLGSSIQMTRAPPRLAAEPKTQVTEKGAANPTAVVPALVVAVSRWPKRWGEDKWFCSAVSTA